MWTAFPSSGYYGLSAPPRGQKPTVDPPVPTLWLSGGEGNAGMVPTFTMYRLTR